MFFSTSTLILLSYATLSLGSIISRTSELCPGARIVKTEKVGEAEFKTFECADTSFSSSEATTTRIPDVNPNSTFATRQFQNCAGGAADRECQCAILCNLDFCARGVGGSAGPPLQSDCEALSNELSGPGSFFVPGNRGVQASFKTCQAVWFNRAASELEYCFQNFASSISAQYTNCAVIKKGGQGGCEADNGLWFMEFLPTGNTILAP
ncbi:hypothetical protein K474DRAFT_1662103 [Panus rudis PR-1116 ss-1]|nr:hypothetical protein K474DRAFT_1662103 [Panus rudis PR-1116 ss-1]